MVTDQSLEWLEKGTFAEQVYRHVRRLILSGEFAPGTEVNELSIADSLGMSRGPVREAMGRLRAEGLIEVRPRRGAFVPSLRREEFVEAYQVREALEVLGIRLATAKLDQEAIEVLETEVERMSDLAEDDNWPEFFEANASFHGAIIGASQNGSLVRIHEGLVAQMSRYWHSSALLRGDLLTSVGEHRDILDALKKGDEERAAKLMSAHIRIPQNKVYELTESEWATLANPSERAD